MISGIITVVLTVVSLSVAAWADTEDLGDTGADTQSLSRSQTLVLGYRSTGIGFGNTRRLKGLQIGLLNYAGNNPAPFKLLPLLNVNLGQS